MSTLPANDLAFLDERGLDYRIEIEGGMVCIVFSAWPLPPGYTTGTAELLIRLSSGYPDICPDMWWFSPAVTRSDGAAIQATESTEYYLGKSWQRWSRHFQNGQWLAGTDGLESYLALVTSELRRCAAAAA